MTSTTTPTDLATRVINMCEQYKNDPFAPILRKCVLEYLDSKSELRTQAEYFKAIQIPTIDDAIKIAKEKPGGLIIYVGKKYYFFSTEEDFKRYCQNAIKDNNPEKATHYYLIPTSQKHNVVIIFDGTDPAEYKKLCGYLKDHLNVDPWDVKIIPAMYCDDRSDLVIKSKVGTFDENEKLVTSFRRYVREQDKNLSKKISDIDIVGDDNIGKYIRLALSFRDFDTKTWEMGHVYGMPNIVFDIKNIIITGNNNIVGDNNKIEMKLTAPEFTADEWIVKNPPPCNDSMGKRGYYNCYREASKNAGASPINEQAFSRLVEKAGYKSGKSAKYIFWIK